MADDTASALRRWAAAHAATLAAADADGAGAGGAGAGPEAAATPSAVSVPAVLSSFTEVATLDTGFWTNAVAWATHPDGRRLLAAADGSSVLIWDYGSGSPAPAFSWTRDDEESPERILAAAWGQRPDGQPLLATLDDGGAVRVWDPGQGGLLQLIPPRPAGGRVFRGAVRWGRQPDGGPLLASAGDDAVWAWNSGSGRFERGRSWPAETVTDVTWGSQQDGRPLLIFGTDEGNVRTFDPDSGRLLQTLVADQSGRQAALAWTRRTDGRQMLAAAVTSWFRDGPSELHVWGAAGGEFAEVASVRYPAALDCVAWGDAGDGRLVLAGTTDAGPGGTAIELWDGYTLSPLGTHRMPDMTGGYSHLSWTLTPDGQLLLAAGSSERKVRVYEAVLDPPVQLPARRGRGGEAHRLAAVHRPPELLNPPQDVTPEFEVGDGQSGPASSAVYRVRCAIGDNGHVLVAAGLVERLITVIWDATTGALLHVLDGVSLTFGQMDWGRLPDGRLTLATEGPAGAGVVIWDAATGEAVNRFPPDGPSEITALAWLRDRDGRPQIATAEGTGLCLRDPESGAVRRVLPGAQPLFVLAEGWLADGRHCLVTENGNAAEIWDLDTGGLIRALTHADTPWQDTMWSAAWGTAGDGRGLLFVGRANGSIQCWDPDSGELLRTRAAHDGFVQTLVPVSQPGLPAALVSGARDGKVRIWDQDTLTPLAELPGATDFTRALDVAVAAEGGPLLVFPASAGEAFPRARFLRVVRIATSAVSDDVATRTGRAARNRAGDLTSRLARIGGGGLWPPAGLVADLITLTGPGRAATRPDESTADEPAAGEPLSDTRLRAIAAEPGIARLRQLAGRQPAWRPGSRTAFAALLTASLDLPERYRPPAGPAPAQLETALASALTERRPGSPAAPWPVPLADLRAAAAAVTDQVITLLTILGPGACAADPLLPLRLAHQLPRLPALSPGELRLLATFGTRPPADETATAGTTAWSPGTAGLAKSGPLTRLLPTQLALPPDLLTVRLADNQLLYRQHRAPAPPTPEPVTIILDTTPAAFGPAGHALRLAAHLVTLTLWQHGRYPALITLDQPGTVTEPRSPADLLRIWTSGTLMSPGPPLSAAEKTAAALGQPTVLCTHFQTARDYGGRPGPASRLLTAHQPPDKPPARPATRWHAHLPPAPGRALLAAAVHALLAPAADHEDARHPADRSG